MKRTVPGQPDRQSGLTLLLATLTLVLTSVSTTPAKKPKKVERHEDLARIYVFYSEPRFEYQPKGEVRIRLATIWGRDKKERKIREAVAEKGADVVILDRSYLEFDEAPRIVREPSGHLGETVTKLRLPTQSAYVEGRLATRVEETPARDCERVYTEDFETVWAGVLSTVKTLGWELETIDTDSRYVTTEPSITSASTMACTDPTSGWLPAVFTVYVNSYEKKALVRLDVAFVDRSTLEPTECRSVGVYEAAFFGKLDRRLADD
jgi:hypothetical protein